MKYLSENKMKNLKKNIICVIFMGLFSMSAMSLKTYADILKKPQNALSMVDAAGMFTSREVANIQHILVTFADSTSNRIEVVTVNDFNGLQPSQYAFEIGEQWGIGNKKFDNGIVILIKPKTAQSRGQVFIAVGYGLEGAIPDATAKLIVEKTMLPRFRANDYYGGLVDGIEVLKKLAAGEISYKEYKESNSKSGLGSFILFLLLFVVLPILIVSFTKHNGPTNMGGGRRRLVSGTHCFYLQYFLQAIIMDLEEDLEVVVVSVEVLVLAEASAEVLVAEVSVVVELVAAGNDKVFFLES